MTKSARGKTLFPKHYKTPPQTLNIVVRVFSVRCLSARRFSGSQLINDCICNFTEITMLFKVFLDKSV